MKDIPHLSETELAERLRAAGLLTPRVREALALARSVHGGAVRDDGTPYLTEHIFPIAAAVAAYAQEKMPAEAEAAVQIALLHDALEDAEDLDKDELAERLDPFVADCVAALTKPPKTGSDRAARENRDRRYFAAVRQAPRIAQVVKVFDRLNNLACLSKSAPTKRGVYIEETRAFHLPLARSLDAVLADRMEALLRDLESGTPETSHGLASR